MSARPSRQLSRTALATFALLACASGCSRNERAPQAVVTSASASAPAPVKDTGAAAEGHGVLPTTDVVQGVSIYGLGATFTDQRSRPFKLPDARGFVTVVAMFYASCPHACPTLIRNIKHAESLLSADERRDLRVVLVSIDPENDTPKVLAEVVKRFEVDGARWTLLTGREDDVRDVAAVLGVKYREDDGSINHSSVITLLDRDGKISARFDGLTDTRGPQSSRIRALMAAR